MQKGLQLERDLSKNYHPQVIPLLLSSLFLREWDCGQVDIAFFTPERIVLIESKFSSRDIDDFGAGKKYGQKRRLFRTSTLLGLIFSQAVEISYQGRNHLHSRISSPWED